MPDRVTGRDIILGILENMRESLEPLLYTTLAPALYDVYLHVDDYEWLEGVMPLIIDEAKVALNKAVDDCNRNAKGKKWKPPISAKAQDLTFLRPVGGWEIVFHQSMDDGVNPGDLIIESTLALPEKPGIGAGMETRMVRTIRSEGGARMFSVFSKVSDGDASDRAALAKAETVIPGIPAKLSDEKAFARITWRDNRDQRAFLMIRNQIAVGRGGSGHLVDLKLESSPDISREHFRLRRDERTGEFFISDLSVYGTVVNGRKLPSSIEEVNGIRRDLNLEEPLPRKASIRLADALTLEFEAMEKK